MSNLDLDRLAKLWTGAEEADGGAAGVAKPELINPLSRGG